MYITGIENVTRITFEDGDLVAVLDCGGLLKIPFLSADTDLLYMSEELVFSCLGCPDKGKPECLVTKVERKKDADNTD